MITKGNRTTRIIARVVSSAANVRRPRSKWSNRRWTGQVEKHNTTAHNNADTNGRKTNRQPISIRPVRIPPMFRSSLVRIVSILRLVPGAIRGAQEVSSSFWRASSLEITAESQVQIYAFAEAGSADLRQLNFCGEIFTGKTQDGEHVDLALFKLLPAKFHGVGTARNRVAQRAFAFMQIVVVSESVFHIFERAQCGADIACGGGFLLGGAEILRSLEFTPEENWLSYSSGKS